MRQKIRAQAEAQHGKILLIHKRAQLADLLGREKLRLVGDYDVVLPGAVVLVHDVLLGRDYLCAALQADAAFYDVRAIAGVDAGLYEPDGHAQLLIVEFGYQRLRGLG